MLKQRKNQPPFVLRLGISALLVVGIVSAGKTMGWLENLPKIGQLQAQLTTRQLTQEGNSAVLPLVQLPPSKRAAKLAAIASGPDSLDKSRARYMLANDLIKQNQGQKALATLAGLERDYALLADFILVKRARSYDIIGDKTKATETWKELLERYPKNPAAAEALFALGQSDRKYWEQAIAQFPSYPRTHEIARQLLKQNPDRLPLMLLLVKHDPESRQTSLLLDRLTTQYAARLKPEDWEAIGFIYWENRVYGKAGDAYAKAPPTALNIYRAGRGRQLGDDRVQAVVAYKKLASEFPDAKETGTALLRLAELAKTPQEALPYLDLAIKKFPEEGGEALLIKTKLFDRISNTKAATQALELAQTKYGDSDKVAEYRWRSAQQKAKVGDLSGAWQFARDLTQQNPKSELAPKAGFWVGKWADRLGRQKDARAAFEYVLTAYPESYYAWRSAVMLGLPVGDFTTVRPLSPKVVRPQERPQLPVGSAAVQELYQLGQDREAWMLWQVEFNNYLQPTVAEQFTDGLLRLGAGENLKGIYEVASLGWREKPEEMEQVATLKQQPAYWHALYPFPFFEFVETWSKPHRLNPLLVTALIRQESRFEPTIRSVANATGLMQLIPSTSEWAAQAVNLKNYSLENPNDNIRLGTWYLAQTHQQYKNNSLLAVASYNAGPGNVSQWLNKIGFSDPDKFVEAIPFDETKDYVKNVFENYWNYMRLYNPETAQLLARYQRK